MRKLLLLLSILGLGLGACGASEAGDSADHGGHSNATPATAVVDRSDAGQVGEPTAGTEFDQQFIASMIAHHESAIEMARVAVEQAEHPELKQLANEIIRAQEAENEQMARWNQEWYGGESNNVSDNGHSNMPGMQMEGAMGVSAEELRDAEPFDRAFIDAMIPHHQGAIVDARAAIEKATHPELKELAKNIVKTQQREINQMQQWRSEWYPAE